MKKSQSYKFTEITALFLNSPTFSETCQDCMKIMQYCSFSRVDYEVDERMGYNNVEEVEYNKKKITILNKNFKIIENLLKMPKIGFLGNKIEQ